MKFLTTAALGFAASVAAYSNASATLTFTWSPSALGATFSGIPNVTADNVIVSDFADITLSNTGVFNENAVLVGQDYVKGGLQVNGSELNTNYSIFAIISAQGSGFGAAPAEGSGLSTSGTFSSVNYTLFASANPITAVTLNTGGTPTITGGSPAIPLFTGTLVNGTATLTAPAGGGYSPKADINLTLTACTSTGIALATGGFCSGDESSFFVAPLPADINMVISDFSATTSVTSLGGSNPTDIDINGGGGNFTLANVVPEPASLMVLGSGLIALGATRRRSNRG